MVRTFVFAVLLLLLCCLFDTADASFYRGSCLKVKKCLNSRECEDKDAKITYGNSNAVYAQSGYQAEPDEQVYVMVAVSQSIGRIRNRYPNKRYFGRPLCSNVNTAQCVEGEVIAYETTTALTSQWSRRPVYTESLNRKQVYVGRYASEQLYRPQDYSYQFARWKQRLNTGYRMDNILTMNT